MKTLTIFTPTYNRRELLKNAYNSLLSQTSDDFLWMIVDDGSTDGTETEVKKWIDEGKIEIIYLYKENGGKHTAINTALKTAVTPLIANSLDSDDILLPNAVETIVDAYKSNPDINNCCGMVFMKQVEASRKKFNANGKIQIWRDAIVSGDFYGESMLVFKTEYIKHFSYPVFEGEKFVTEACLYLNIDEPMLWSTEIVYAGAYMADGYTKNIKKIFKQNPQGYKLYNNIRLKYFGFGFKKIKYAAYYDGFSLLCGGKHFIKESNSPFLCALMLPAGVLFAFMLRMYKCN